MNDEEMVFIEARTSDEFTQKVNVLLKEGRWRIAETEMYTTNMQYYALMIRSVEKRGTQDV